MCVVETIEGATDCYGLSRTDFILDTDSLEALIPTGSKSDPALKGEQQ